MTPIRNEEGKVYKWDEKLILMNPENILFARFEEALDHVVVRLHNGDELIIDYNLKEFAREFAHATEEN